MNAGQKDQFASLVWGTHASRRFLYARLLRMLLGAPAQTKAALIEGLGGGCCGRQEVCRDRSLIDDGPEEDTADAMDSPNAPKIERMTSFERVETAIHLKVPDRVPFGPFIMFWAAPQTGLRVYEWLFDYNKGRRASRDLFAKLGGVDLLSFYPCYGYFHYGFFSYLFNWYIPGPDMEDVLPQFVELPVIEGPDGYDRLIEDGVAPLLKRPYWLPKRQEYKLPGILRKVKREWNYWERSKTNPVRTWVAAAIPMPVELLSWLRTLQPFLIDIHRYPDKISAACDFLANGLCALIDIMIKLTGRKRVMLDCNRASGTFITPQTFAELVLPSFKTIVNHCIRSGYEITFHLDTDWTPMLEFFREFPLAPGQYIIELENTNMAIAKELLGDRMCLKGNVSSTLLRLGTPHKISEVCRALIRDLGNNGGYILCSGCEVPIDAPFRNVKAMADSVNKFGHYS